MQSSVEVIKSASADITEGKSVQIIPSGEEGCTRLFVSQPFPHSFHRIHGYSCRSIRLSQLHLLQHASAG